MRTTFKIGDKVTWINSPYIISYIKGDSALLTQDFSIKTTLNGFIDISELTKRI